MRGRWCIVAWDSSPVVERIHLRQARLPVIGSICERCAVSSWRYVCECGHGHRADWFGNGPHMGRAWPFPLARPAHGPANREVPEAHSPCSKLLLAESKEKLSRRGRGSRGCIRQCRSEDDRCAGHWAAARPRCEPGLSGTVGGSFGSTFRPNDICYLGNS